MTELPCVGQKIRARRLKMGMTQQDLAGDTFTKSFISQLEKSHARPSLRSLQIIAARLGKPVGYFLGEEYAHHPADPDKVDHLTLLASRIEQEGKLSDAVNYYKEALSLTDKDDYQRRGRLCFQLGKAYRELGQPSDAMRMLELASAELERAGDWELLSYTHNGLGDLLLGLEQVEPAILSFEKALDATQRHPELLPGLHTTTLTNLGIAFARAQQYEKAEHNLLLALKGSGSNQTYYKYGDICMALGYIYFHQQALEDANRFTTRAWHFYVAIENENLQVQCQINQGSIERALGNFAVAEKQLLQAAEKARTLGQPFHEAHALEELAEVYLDWQPTVIQELDKAETVLEKAFRLYTDARRQAAVKQLLGEVFYHKQRLDKAVEALTEAAELLEGVDDKSRLAEVYSRLGELCQLQGDNDQATKFLQRSVNIFREMQLKTNLKQ